MGVQLIQPIVLLLLLVLLLVLLVLRTHCDAGCARPVAHIQSGCIPGPSHSNIPRLCTTVPEPPCCCPPPPPPCRWRTPSKEAIDKLVKDGKAPASLARVSEKLTSAQGLARRSTIATQGDVESRPTLPRSASLQDTMSELQEAVQVRTAEATTHWLAL